MTNNRVAGAEASEGRKSFGGIATAISVGIAKFFLWLTVGNGSSLLYTFVSAWILYFWTTDESRVVAVLAGFGIYSLFYVIIQIVTLLVVLYTTGGSMIRAGADFGTSLMPAVPLIILGTLVFTGGFSPTWLSYIVGAQVALAVVADLLAVLIFMRATQKTFETPEAHAAAH